MPLDFNSTKQFRDFVISKTLLVPNGPQTFTDANYRLQKTNDFVNVDPGAVDTNRAVDLLQIQNTNIFKPLQYLVKENLDTLPRRANLQLYYTGTPYFFARNHSLVSIMINSNYDTESELFKFAASYIRDRNQKGPVYARIEQNLLKSTVGRVRLIDALNGNLATVTNIITGKEPLIENNYSITVAKSLLGKTVDFIQTVAGVEFPFSEIPGDYLSNPANPVNPRNVPNSQFGKILQDTTGVLGSFFGIDRRPTVNKNPSDVFIEYMGSGQKQVLFDQLSYSKYAPNYTTTARQQNTSKPFNFIANFAQNIKNTLGVEAPDSKAYIGDDRGQDVKYAMNDFNDRTVRGTYYLGIMFDKVQTELFEKQKNLSEGGQSSGKLTWISVNSRNQLGVNNNSWNDQRGKFEDSLSTKFDFRDSSILGVTQDILDSMPTDGGEARSHIANSIDQTARIFREGNTYISKGSAIKYVGKKGEEGVEYCRTWTKDRPYLTYSDTMKKGNNLRKFDASVISDPWNLNIAPMSNGNKGFENSSNIFKSNIAGTDGTNFYAQKYMFSLENLAWKTSDKPGFTVLDLPFCERGPSGGRIMWFPPYDLKVSENNSANWERNDFLGRPEPIYTYKNTERTGQISFKIVVDHPSILNLLVREEFKNLSDDEADNYINAFFAGCQDLDFYDLIRRYATLDTDDVNNIISYLNNKNDTYTITTYKTQLEEVTQDSPEVTSKSAVTEQKPTNEKSEKYSLFFDDDIPGEKNSLKTPSTYSQLYVNYITKKEDYKNKLTSAINNLNASALNVATAKIDREILFGANKTGTTESVNILNNYFTGLTETYNAFTGKTGTLKQSLIDKRVQEITVNISSGASSPATVSYNKKLSMRRSFSVLKEFLKNISKEGTITIDDNSIPWFSEDIINESPNFDSYKPIISFKDIGYDYDGEIRINLINYGETYDSSNSQLPECSKKEFKHVKSLNIVSPISFFCRKSDIDFSYTIAPEKITPKNPEPKKDTYKEYKSTLVPTQTTVDKKPTKPPIDVMKRIIMKTLSECFYFKKLEENSPLVFSSLREKLKYFHPGFHSTTPEGLNSRLTFLHQCIRPGDTIPIKGIEGKIDNLNARNTSFGPPPICVLRIGDFYHSKVTIKDVNITYEDSPWDMNPEGIGLQPIIANVTLSINFIGGQGLEKPVEKLQNALSSNFYANTEIYDERAQITTTTIQGEKYADFTKSFLEDLQRREINNPVPESKSIDEPNVQKNKIIGEIIKSPEGDETISYTKIIKKLFETTKNYFEKYEELYNNILLKYGYLITHLILLPNYRTKNKFIVYKNNSTTTELELFGEYKKGKDLQKYVYELKILLNDIILSLNGYTTNLCEVLTIDTIIPPQKINYTNTLLRRVIRDSVIEILDSITSEKSIIDYVNIRNEMIYNLEFLNFITKNGYDVSLDGDKTYLVTLKYTDDSAFDNDEYYSKYSTCISYIETNTTLLYADLNYEIDYNALSISNNELYYFLSEMLYDYQNKINEVFDNKVLAFDDAMKNKIKNKLSTFFVKNVKKEFNFSSFIDYQGLEYTYKRDGQDTETNDTQIKEQAKKLFTIPYISDNDLNFYKLKSY